MRVQSTLSVSGHDQRRKCLRQRKMLEVRQSWGSFFFLNRKCLGLALRDNGLDGLPLERCSALDGACLFLISMFEDFRVLTCSTPPRSTKTPAPTKSDTSRCVPRHAHCGSPPPPPPPPPFIEGPPRSSRSGWSTCCSPESWLGIRGASSRPCPELRRSGCLSSSR